MGTKRFKDLKRLSDSELSTKLREVEAELFQVRMKHVTRQLKDTSSIWRLRKDIARLKTLASQSNRGKAE